AARRQLQLSGTVLDVGEAVDVKLEDLGGVLNAQPVTCAQVLVNPDLKVLALGHRDRRFSSPLHVCFDGTRTPKTATDDSDAMANRCRTAVRVKPRHLARGG